MAIVVIGDNTGDDFSGTIDTEIKQNAATTNYGGGVTVETTKYGSGDHTHALLAFTGLSNVTGPVTVTTATLSLWLATANAGSHTVSWYRLLQNWVEAQATWNIYSTGNNWGTAGGLNATDRSGTLSASLAAIGTTTGQYYDWTGEQLDTDVQNFINGTQSNYGWHGERTDAANDATYRIWVSRESGNDGQRPYLTVDYSAAAAAAPKTLLLMGVG